MTQAHQPTIEISHLSKTYRIYSGGWSRVREVLGRSPSQPTIEALKDVHLQIAPGETFGLIGGNGAGKSTLLKILTGTTFPTSGEVTVRGRVGALLELGAGFHPEFTGRKNIYLTGALMGLDRQEVRRREEGIIAFSELSDFIDQPVKTYSSGMFVRLAFSVSTSFDPDILIIDEVLTVGDQIFQKKCTDRILSFKKRGKTILFCSHNLHQVKALCDRALWLHQGREEALGKAGEVIGRYEDYCRKVESDADSGDEATFGKEKQFCWVEKVSLHTQSSTSPPRFQTGDSVTLDIWVRFSAKTVAEPGIGVALLRNDGQLLYVTATTFDGIQLRASSPDLYHARITFPEIPLLAGSYYFNVVTTDESSLQAYSALEKVAPFRVETPSLESGVLRLTHYWESESIPPPE